MRLLDESKYQRFNRNSQIQDANEFRDEDLGDIPVYLYDKKSHMILQHYNEVQRIFYN